MVQQLQGLERWGLLLLRVFLGFIFALHGAQKFFGPAFFGFPWQGYLDFFTKVGITPAPLWLWVVTVTELVGGLCLMVGLLTRVWAAGLVIDMAVAILRVHLPNGFFWLRPGGGLEFPLTLGVMALVVLLAGPSMAAVDRAIGLERREA